MLIKEVDFNDISEFKNVNVIPVFFVYGKMCYEIAKTINQIDKAWFIFSKIFYYNFNIDYGKYLRPYFNFKYLLSDLDNKILFFSSSDMSFGNHKSTDKDTAIKFANDAYFANLDEKFANLAILKEIFKYCKIKNFKLFVINQEELNNSKFSNEYLRLKNYFKNKRFTIKNGNLVVGHINGIILSKEEKLIQRIRREFSKRTLLGDIIFNEDEDILLKSFMRQQLFRLRDAQDSSDFFPNYCRVFAVGLVRYAMHNYNKNHTGDFWTHLNEEFGVSLTSNKQTRLHDVFENVLLAFYKPYSINISNRIDNITMHSFVADNSANQFFDYLFDFWRLDLLRNVDNLNGEDGDELFDTLISAIKNGTQNVMSHTSLLLNFTKSKKIFKNRVKRILKLMNACFWDNAKINITGNRINNLLDCWINNPKGAFQKEINYSKKVSLKNKGDILYHSPTFFVDSKSEVLKFILPQQRLLNCNEDDYPIWHIECLNNDVASIEKKPIYKRDKIGFYVEKCYVEMPLHYMLFGFNVTLLSNSKEIKSYKIEPSNVRFFDDKNRYINHNISLIPPGHITAYSNDERFPSFIDRKNGNNLIYSDGLAVRFFDFEKGQIILLDKRVGIQIGQKLNEGLNEAYPISGAYIKKEDITYSIYNKLPVLVFKAEEDEINGISLVINGIQNKIADKEIITFKLADELEATGYFLNLDQFIKKDGLYDIVLSFPKMHKRQNFGLVAYANNFQYEFKNAPYVFKSLGTISFPHSSKIIKNYKCQGAHWDTSFDTLNFNFNFSDRNPMSDNYCDAVEGTQLKLKYPLDGEIYDVYFDIPALFWKFSLEDNWNTKEISSIMLKDFKNKYKKLYVTGPFNFSDSSIIAPDDIDIAEEESEIKINNKTPVYYETNKIYEWFKNDRKEVYRYVYIFLEGESFELFKVVCKSKLNGVHLIADFDNNILTGEVDIVGNELYTVSIYHDDDTICEDLQIVDNKFKIETELKSGNYKIYVYEILENDSDGFELDSESFLVNSEPLIKKIINIKDLEHNFIRLYGMQDLNKKYMPYFFAKKYFIANIEKIKYEDIDDEIYGIWNDKIDPNSEEQMSKYPYYSAVLYSVNGKEKTKLSKVLILFTDYLSFESIIILVKDDDGYGSLFLNMEKKIIVLPDEYGTLNNIEKRNCGQFYDDWNFYIIDVG